MRSARLSLGKGEVDVDGNLSSESGGFDSLPIEANHQSEASLAWGAVRRLVKRRQRVLKPRD